MKTVTKEIQNPCVICGKDVIWGNNGCPLVANGSEMGVLFGVWQGMIHYNCTDKHNSK